VRFVRPVVQTVSDVTGRVRDLNRLQEVGRILAGHGLGMLVAGIDLPGTRNLGRTFASTPDRLKRAIEQLGPTYVKLGQVLSTRPDLLPEAYIVALQELQDDVDPLPWEAVKKKLDKDLGSDWVDAFAWFDDTPLATASIAQVHRGRLNDGTEVVLKVQRPGIGPKIRSDLNILQFLAKRALVEYPESRAFDPVGVVAEFEHSILAELDFVLEVRNMERVRANFHDTPFVKIPKIYSILCCKTVLCMEFLDGIKMRDARTSGCDMTLLGQRYLTAAYDMLFQHGLFHGDLHPGNVIVLPGEVIGLLDFGMVGRMTPEMRNNIISIIFALQRGDYRTIARLFYDIAIKDERVDFQAVETATIEIMERHWTGNSVKDMQLGPFVVDLAAAAARHGARVPRTYTMFFKAILTSEGLAKTLIDEVDPIAAAEPYIRAHLRETFGEERIKQDAFYHFVTLSTLTRRLPIVISQFLDDVERQQVRFDIRDPEREETLRRQDSMVNRLVIAALTIAAYGCGTALLVGGTLSLVQLILAVMFYVVGSGLFAMTAGLVARSRF
jgi:ubiquinone biosynthesis protein